MVSHVRLATSDVLTIAPRGHSSGRIAIVAPPWIPIPPPAYGGIEQVVALQARVLADSGYEVTLVAAPGSNIAGVHCVTPLDSLPAYVGERDAEWHYLLAIDDLLDDHDLIIDHSGPLGAVLLGHRGVPVMHVTHGELHADATRIYEGIAKRSPSLRYVAISEAQRSTAPTLPFAGVALNALDTTHVPFSSHPDGYLAFLGRMAPEKGALEAIEIAQASGRPIMLAAKCREPAEIAYFERYIEPRLGDDVIWMGEIGEMAKYELLVGADALVFPISWPEPFGMVMIEAMACGTPVLATPRGAVPEVVIDGRTGFIAADLNELADAVSRLGEIDRVACRDHVEREFSPTRFAQRWERLIHSYMPTRSHGQRRHLEQITGPESTRGTNLRRPFIDSSVVASCSANEPTA